MELLLILLILAVEANIVSSSQSSNYQGKYPASLLLDGKGLDGIFQGDSCAHTEGGPLQWVSFELESPKKLSHVQITPRLDHMGSHGDLRRSRAQNVVITIGPSKSYDPNEPLCLPMIPQLVLEAGLTDYKCTGTLHEGKYVKIARGVDGSSDGMIEICEVKIFTL